MAGIDLQLGKKSILKGLEMQLLKGEFVYLVGKTGVGKSSLLKLIYGDNKSDEGIILLGETRVDKAERKDVPHIRRKLGIVFQDYQLLPDRTVAQNILFALKATGWKQKAQIRRRISEVLMQVGMTGKAHERPHTLSGGEQQRVAIARALINEPVLMIADEPTGNLDPEASYHLMNVMRNINRAGTTILIATHEYGLMRHFPGRILELEDAKLKEYHQVEDFFAAYRSRFGATT
ncbi:MAG: ATP-binding cassette domain-containing protein [Bacteroidota bacterium]